MIIEAGKVSVETKGSNHPPGESAAQPITQP